MINVYNIKILFECFYFNNNWGIYCDTMRLAAVFMSYQEIKIIRTPQVFFFIFVREEVILKNRLFSGEINEQKIDFRKIEGYNLDNQQLTSIENDSLNTLVVAGAGTGKTTTIIGKVKWILEKWRQELPPKILILSFTHASKEELKQRILIEILKDDLVFQFYKPDSFLKVETFHSLALKILKNGGARPSLTTVDFDKYLRENHPAFPEEKRDLFCRLHGLLRNYHLTDGDLLIQNRLEYGGWWRKWWKREIFLANQETIQLLKDLTDSYTSFLAKRQETDFTGLLEGAIRDQNFADFCFDYVIIDEYQDLSPLEYQLVRSLRNFKDFRLFCVGDDWQTIYQFAGSEIDLILNFEKHWGETERFKIEQTYRFPEQLAKTSGEFIMQNPKQLKKEIRGIKCLDPDQIIEINGPSERTDLDALYFFFLALPQNTKVFLIGRYNFDIRKISHCEFLKVEIQDSYSSIRMVERDDLKITFISAHKAKGLQADYVLIINCRNEELGFPSQIREHQIIGLVHSAAVNKLQGNNTKRSARKSSIHDDFSEERRLFYVAMTRARKELFLLTVREKESPFVLELRGNKNLKTYKLE